MDDADSVHAEVAREMVLRHDWVTLYANGIRYLEKAPVLYWSMAASFKLFGPHDWAARLPLALGMLAILLAVYRFGRSSERTVLRTHRLLRRHDPRHHPRLLHLHPLSDSRRARLPLDHTQYLCSSGARSRMKPPTAKDCALFAACCALNV